MMTPPKAPTRKFAGRRNKTRPRRFLEKTPPFVPATGEAAEATSVCRGYP